MLIKDPLNNLEPFYRLELHVLIVVPYTHPVIQQCSYIGVWNGHQDTQVGRQHQQCYLKVAHFAASVFSYVTRIPWRNTPSLTPFSNIVFN